MANAWNILGLVPGADERSVKRAYAALLKKTRPEDDPVAYQALREAYEHALAVARRAGAQAVQPVEVERGDVETVVVETVMAEKVVVEPAAMEATPAAPFVPEIPEQPPAAAAEKPHHVTFAAPHVNHLALAGAELHAFLAQPGANLRQRLRQQLRGEVLTDLRTREMFELLAARHCARADCPETVRTAIVDELGWADDSAHLARLDPEAIDTALARRRADYSFNALEARRSSDPAIDFLLSEHLPHLTLKMLDSRFVQQMRNALDEIRWQHADARRFRLNEEVVARWERKIATKRYTVQTFLLSFLSGLLLTIVMQALLGGDKKNHGLIAALCYGLTIGGVAVYAFCTPVPLRTRAAMLYEKWFANGALIVHGELLRRCWAGIFAVISLLLFVDAPGLALQLLTLTMLGLCVAAGLLLLAPMLEVSLCVFIAIQGILVGTFLSFGQGEGRGTVDLINCILAGICLSMLRLTSELNVMAQRARFGRNAAWIPAAWLAGCVALLAAMGSGQPGMQVLAVLSWLWLVGGIMVVSFGVNVFAVVIAFFALRYALDAANLLPDLPPGGYLRTLQPMLLAISLYAVRTMYMSAKETTPPVSSHH